MPTFDITSEFNNQEITNAVDQAYREIANRYDFRDTGTSIAFNEKTIVLKSSTEERLNAAEQVLKEKFGDKVIIKTFEKPKGFIARKLSSSTQDPIEKLANIIEEKSMWQKFGL